MNKKAILKTITWRCIATAITFVVTFALTCPIEIGAAISGVDTVLKLVFYYLHEKGWEQRRNEK